MKFGSSREVDFASLWQRAFLPPLHPGGWRIIPIFVVATLILFWIWTPLGWIGVAATLWCATLFREPKRIAPMRSVTAVSPIDGLVAEVGSAPPPADLALGIEDLPCVSILLGPWDSHAVRAPADGRLAKQTVMHDGRRGERIAVRIECDSHAVGLVLIADGMGRRISTDLDSGAPLKPGDRFGVILFAGRAELYLPAGTIAAVAVGQRMVAGETILAELQG
jgi:phosphatidylserine decarboxylase